MHAGYSRFWFKSMADGRGRLVQDTCEQNGLTPLLLLCCSAFSHLDPLCDAGLLKNLIGKMT